MKKIVSAKVCHCSFLRVRQMCQGQGTKECKLNLHGLLLKKETMNVGEYFIGGGCSGWPLYHLPPPFTLCITVVLFAWASPMP